MIKSLLSVRGDYSYTFIYCYQESVSYLSSYSNLERFVILKSNFKTHYLQYSKNTSRQDNDMNIKKNDDAEGSVNDLQAVFLKGIIPG